MPVSVNVFQKTQKIKKKKLVTLESQTHDLALNTTISLPLHRTLSLVYI
jgi:hypothetical protein